MKILLFGEFSGLHNNLKDGLIKLGHEVVIASGKDGFKDIGNDINLDPIFSGFIGKIESRLKPFYKLPKLIGFDVVQIINPFYPNTKFFPKEFFYFLLRTLNKKFFILGAGSDAFFWKYGKKTMRYSPFKEWLKYDIQKDSYYMQSKKSFNYNNRILKTSNGIIPVMYEYESCYQSSPKRLNTIPLPINLESIEYCKNIIRNKIVIFHGLNRYGFKGTKHVEEAFKVLKEKYPNDLELIIDGQMPLNDYLDIMKRSNVVIDQTSSYSLGMNGLFALAMGKVVLGGAEKEGLDSLRIKESPVINILPSQESIVNAIEILIENKSEISTLGQIGRKFIETHHCSLKIAMQFEKTWKTN